MNRPANIRDRTLGKAPAQNRNADRRTQGKMATINHKVVGVGFIARMTISLIYAMDQEKRREPLGPTTHYQKKPGDAD